MTAQVGEDRTPEPWLVERIEAKHIDIIWPLIEPYLQNVLRHGQGDSITVGSIYLSLVEDKQKLWVVTDGTEVYAACIFSVINNPANVVLFVSVLAGRQMDDWADVLIERLAHYRGRVGADCVECSARLGLAKYLSKKGWKKKAVIMELRK